MTLSTGRSEYTSWDRGQPDNWRGNQNCAYNNFRKRAGRWDDGGCKTKFQAMCEASGIFNSKCFFKTVLLIIRSRSFKGFKIYILSKGVFLANICFSLESWVLYLKK